jgi:hypothetical protein
VPAVFFPERRVGIAVAGFDLEAAGFLGGPVSFPDRCGLFRAACFPALQPRERRKSLHFSIGISSSGVDMVSFQRLKKPKMVIDATTSTICV